MRAFVILVAFSAFLSPITCFAVFGLEIAPLLQLVSGQVTEIERLSQQVGLAKGQQDLLLQLNDGINRTVDQIQSLEAIVERAQDLDPTAIRSIADLNDYLARVNDAKQAVADVLGVSLQASAVAISQSALQSETAYRMGQEMISTGANLAQESQIASPGRANQISAATGSAQMLATGVQLQTLAQLAQLQAMQLELQRSQIEEQRRERDGGAAYFANSLNTNKPHRGKR